MQYLQQLDQCGSDFKNRPLNENYLFKSFIGGIGSLIIYSLCLSYFIYGMYTWYDNQILPKVVNLQQYEPIVQTTIKDNLVGIKFKEQFNATLNSPFSYEDNILTILLFRYNDGIMETIPIFQNDTSAINFNNIYLASNQVNRTQAYFSIVVCKCIKGYVGSCAKQSVIDQFFSQRLTQLDLNLYVKQYNYQAKKYEQVEEQFSYSITQLDTFYTQISLQLSKTSVYDNFLFGGSEDSVYISKFDQISQSPDLSYMFNAFNQTIYQTFYITVNNLVQHQQILYPTLGDVLASIGSIVNVLLLLKFIFIKINEEVCYELVVQKVISFYYPEFANQITIKRGYGGTIKQAFYKGVQLDRQQFEEQYEKLRSIANNKLTFANIIYEISRIQFLLGQLITKDQFINSHNMGIKFKSKVLEDEELDCGLDLIIPPEYFGILNLLENTHQHQSLVYQQQM